MESLGCTKSCQICCVETIDEIEARSSVNLRRWSFIFSIAVTLFMLGEYVRFAELGKTLVIPDIVWAIVLAPWLGAGTSKLAAIVLKKEVPHV